MQRSIDRILTTHVGNPPQPGEGAWIASNWMWN